MALYQLVAEVGFGSRGGFQALDAKGLQAGYGG
jgi:hypothetical protein